MNCVFLSCLDSLIIFSLGSFFHTRRNIHEILRDCTIFTQGKLTRCFFSEGKIILNHSITKQSLSKSICLVLPIQVLVRTNLLYNILSRVLAGPQKLKHYVSGTESMLPNIHMLRSTRNVSHGFPTTTTFGELSLPLYS